MPQILKESTWNPVKIGSHSGNHTMTVTSVSSGWFNRETSNDGNRRTKLTRYHQAACSSVEIMRALEIMAEDISSSNADDDDIFYLEYPDEDKMKKSTLKIMNSALELWQDRTKMEDTFFDRVKKTLIFGATFYKENSDGSYCPLHPERMIGYILSPEDDTKVTHYIYDPSAPLICDGSTGTTRTQIGKKTDAYPIPVSDLTILKVGDGPWGESVIERVYSTWRKLQMLEDSVVIYRVTRAAEKRVFYVDTGNLAGPKREKAIEQQRLRLMQKQTSRKNESLDTSYDAHAMNEDIFIPTNSQGKGSRVETLQGAANLGENADLKYFLNKMSAGLRIPSSMVDTQSQDGGRETFNDMRVGQVYQVEMRYMGYIKRIQRHMAKVLQQKFIEFCLDREIVPPENMRFRINAPMSFAMYKNLELYQAQINVMASTSQMNSISKKVALQKFMNFDHEELVENEIAKLMELGLTEDQIKDMSENVISNLVYGDARLGEEYGIEAGAGGRF